MQTEDSDHNTTEEEIEAAAQIWNQQIDCQSKPERKHPM